MKRFSIFLIMIAVIAGMVGCGDGTASDFAGGNGTSSDPYQIVNWYQLHSVRNHLDSHFILMNDLFATTSGYGELASPTANEGKGWQPIGAAQHDSFAGTFDGKGYEICDLFINRPHEDFVGLFGIVNEGGRIENIGVVNADVTGESTVGGLMGFSEEGTTKNSYSTGSVTGNSSVGGLVGFNKEGAVTDSYSSGNVTGHWNIGGLVGTNSGPVSNSYSTSSVTGTESIGGLVGWNDRGTVSDCYSSGSVSGETDVGGLVGRNYGTVSNSYSMGIVIGGSRVGGLAGASYLTTVSDSFWDTQTSGQSTSIGGTGKTTVEMKSIATFSGAGWNIVAVANPGTRNPSYIWNIVDGQTYPFLSWQSVS